MVAESAVPTSFFEQIATHLSKFAKVPAVNTEEFVHRIDFAIICWVVECGAKPQAEARNFLKSLADMNKTATKLMRQLERARHRLEEAQDKTAAAKRGDRHEWWKQLLFTAHAADFGIIRHARPELLAGTVNALSALTAALSEIKPLRRGRQRGASPFPGLAELVFSLESQARVVGGRFTLNKLHRKGTLIQALDWLRAYCLADLNSEWLANLLPRPHQHPVAVYEAAILRARVTARSPEN
jgi:hypothetical protein